MPKLISQNIPAKDNANRTIYFPIIGEATFNEKGELEVQDDKTALDLIHATFESFNFVDIMAPKKELEPADEELAEYKELLNLATETEILELIRDCGDEDFKSRAAAMSNTKRKNGLIKIKQKEIEDGKK